MPNIRHEREVCDLVTRLLLQHRNENLNNHYYPEDENPPPPEAIDAVYTTNAAQYVVEHTTIESYPAQITEDHKISKLIDLEAKLAIRITHNGRYQLLFNTEILNNQKICTTLVERLSDWVAEKAGKLEIGSPSTAPHHMISDSLSGMGEPIKVTLYRWPDTKIGVTVVRSCPVNVTDKILSQVKAAFEKKMPKLIKWASSRKAIPILILETVDPALANGTTIACAVFDAVQEIREKPDTIYIVQTDRDDCEVWECSQPFGVNNLDNRGFFKLTNAI